MKNPYNFDDVIDFREFIEEIPSDDEFLPFWDDLLCPADELEGWNE